MATKKVSNDTLILNAKARIEEQKAKIKSHEKFNPVTNCHLELFNKVYNLNVCNRDELLMLMATLHSFIQYAQEDFKIAGFKISQWLEDVSSKFKVLNIKTEKDRLILLEQALHSRLTHDTRVSLEIDDLIKNI